MSIRRAVPHVLITVAAALALAPAAHATLPDPVWGSAQAIGDPGIASSGQGVLGLSTPTGGVLLGWIVNDPNQGIAFEYRAPGGDWGDVQRVGNASHQITAQAAVGRANGDIVLAWTEDVSNVNHVYTAIIDGETGELGHQTDITGGASGTCPSLAADEDGTVYLAYCSNPTYLRTMAQGSNTWGAPEQVSGNNTGDSGVTVAPNGDVLVSWATWSPTTYHSSTRRAGETSWSAPDTLTVPTDGVGMLRIVGNDEGRFSAAWFDSDGQTYATTYVATQEPGATTWTNRQTYAGEFTYVPALAIDGNGATVLNYFHNNGAYDVLSTSLSAGGSNWAQPESIMPSGSMGGHLGLVSRPDGSVYSLLMHTIGQNFGIGVRARGATNGVWAPIDDFVTDPPSMTDGGGITSDGYGNLFAYWKSADGRPSYVVGDASGPQVATPTIPTTAVAGEPVTVSVAQPTDIWSGVASTTFDFGDGQTATGTSVTHTYARSGSYTVRVTATDSVGNATTTTGRAITVAPGDDGSDDADDTTTTDVTPPPAKTTPVTPPVLLAPTIEALLAGKQVTLNAKVTLKKGQACSGKAVATTTFGTATYRTTLTVKKVGSSCRAVGAIKLKKAPSLRTKLRVTVTSKSASTRVLTTKRS